MSKDSPIENRKKDHIAINVNQDVHSTLNSGLEKYQLLNCALPEMRLDEVNTSSVFFGKQISYPILISSMTGGIKEAERINRNLSEMAQAFNIAMGVGSQRVGLEDDGAMKSFKVRRYAPDILLFANLGAVQLNYGYVIEHCQRAVDTIEADALILHLNPLQEALMEEGDTNFSGLLDKISNICRKLSVPVMVKEVGWGISLEIAKMLVNAGVLGIDVAGAGGTSWSEIEKHRSQNQKVKLTAGAFRHWGIPTINCVTAIRQKFETLPLVASGGLENGVDIAKCIALGADLGGMARQFLLPALKSETALHESAYAITKQFTIAMFAVGARSIKDLKNNKIEKQN